MADELRNGNNRLPDIDTHTVRERSSIDRENVARRAYERYQQRGGQPGRDQQDWFEAERELIAAQHEQE